MEDIVVRNIGEFSSIIEEIEAKSRNLPFGNSKFQNQELVVKRHLTKGRQLRDGLLAINNRIQSLREAYYSRQNEELKIKKKEIEIKKLKSKLSKFGWIIGKYNRELIEIDIKQIELEIEKVLANKNHSDKIIEDAVIEAKDLYESISQLPEYTREEFEAEEFDHITGLYKKEVFKISESVEKLMALGVNIDDVSGESQKLLHQDTIKKIKGE